MGEENQNHVALIVGVTGISGLSLAETLKSPTAPSVPWKVYGSAHRPMPSWFPLSAVQWRSLDRIHLWPLKGSAPAAVDHFLTFDAIDAASTNSALSSISSDITHLFWVAHHEALEETRKIVVNSAMLSNVLDALTRGPTRLRHITLLTGTKQYMGPIFDPELSARLGPPESPFREDFPRLPFPNFYYAMEDVVASYAPRVSHSVHRSSVIIGGSVRSANNALLAVAVYGEICKRVNAPFRFPGTRYAWEHFIDFTDARVLAEQQVWAAVSRVARNEAFNCTNGDVFAWRSMWRVLSDELGMEFVEFDDVSEFDWVGFMRGNGEVWDRIVEEKGLVKTKMEEMVCLEALHFVMSFGFQHVCSVNKSKEFGFMGFVDSLKSVRFWLGRLREMKIIP